MNRPTIFIIVYYILNCFNKFPQKQVIVSTDSDTRFCVSNITVMFVVIMLCVLDTYFFMSNVSKRLFRQNIDQIQ